MELANGVPIYNILEGMNLFALSMIVIQVKSTVIRASDWLGKEGGSAL